MAKIERKITKEELVEKIGAENLSLVLNNVYCVECGPTIMTDYGENIIIEQSGDTILRGKCKKCGGAVARLIETV